MKKKKIRYKILSISLLVGLLTLFLSLMFSVTTSNSKINYFMDKLLFYSAKITTSFLERELNGIYTKAKIISQSTMLKDGIRKNDREALVSMLALFRKDYGLEYNSGTILLKTGTQEIIKIPALSEANDFFGKKAGFEKKIVYSKKKLYFAVNAPVYLEGEVSSNTRLIIIQPITDDFLDSISMISGNDISIIEKNGNIIETTIRGDNGKKILFHIDHLDFEHSFDFIVPGLKYPQTGQISKFYGNDLYFLISQSGRKRIENIKENYMYFFLIGLLCIIASIIFSSITARRISMPLEKLVYATNEISNGNLDYKVKICTGDETEILSDNFNIMVESLKNKIVELDSRVHELNSLNRANQAIINIPDMNKLLYEVLKIVVSSIGCDHGSLMLLEDELLKTKVVYGINMEFKGSGISFPIGDGIAGKALEMESPIFENSIVDSELFLKYEDEIKNSNCRNILVLPLIVDGISIGVINLVNKEGGFDENDLSLSNTLTSEVAIALKNRKLYELAITDGLTQVYIHRYFQARLEEEIFRAKRYNLPLSLIMFDIDHFKKFNDDYGHQAGDIVLKHVAKIASDVVRHDIDFVCRYGGEEFTVVCPGTPYDGAVKLAERIRKSLVSHPIEVKNMRLYVTASFGVSSLDESITDKKILIELADKALYKAKEEGRNKVC